MVSGVGRVVERWRVEGETRDECILPLPPPTTYPPPMNPFHLQDIKTKDKIFKEKSLMELSCYLQTKEFLESYQ